MNEQQSANQISENEANQVKKKISDWFTQILIIVETKDGTVKQVLAPKEVKELAIAMLANENGQIVLSESLKPIKLEVQK